MRAFVTGGTGFVGSHLVEELLRRGYDEVRCLVRSDAKWLGGLSVTTVRGDLDDEVALRTGMEGADLVCHVAGITRAPERAALDEANVEGTLRVLDAAEAGGVSRVLVTSSLAAVGPSTGAPLTEDAPRRPISDYGASTAAMEEAIAARHAAGHGPETVVVRPPAVYGPREADIYTVIRAADTLRLFPIVGDGKAERLDLVYVGDLVRGMADAAEAEGVGGETFFLGGAAHDWTAIHAAVTDALGHGALKLRVPHALIGPAGAAVETVGRLFGTYPPLNREKAREARDSWEVSSEKARAAFGYEPQVDLHEGMQRAVAWYRAHGWL